MYGAVTFYFGNKDEVERDIVESEREEDEFEKAHSLPPHWIEKIERARQQAPARRGRRMIRFLADAGLDQAIVSGCRRREPAMDFLSANDAKLEGVPDPEVLRIAARQGRILVSHDFKTTPHHFGLFFQAGGSSPGVFRVRQSCPIGVVIGDWSNRILRIPWTI